MRPFVMERWQSTYENRVVYNLSESGVHPLTLGELAELAGLGDELGAISLSYGQSNGSDVLRSRIAALYEGATDANVVVTNGSAEANFVALWRLASEGETVVLLPTYMQSHGLVDAFGGRVREVWTREEAKWQPDPDEIRDAVTDRTRVIVVTNPGNPTGAVLSKEARAAIIDAAERSGAWILADEVYTGAELDGPETPSFWGGTERVIATGSLSKAYGLPGLRVGWLLAPHEMAERLWARTDYTTISTGLLTDTLAAAALRADVRPRLIERTREILNHNLPILLDWMDAAGGFHCHPPAAGAICYARYDHPIPPDELAERLRVEQSVLIVPGSHFHMDRYIRFGFGIPAEELREALEHTGRLLTQAVAG